MIKEHFIISIQYRRETVTRKYYSSINGVKNWPPTQIAHKVRPSATFNSISQIVTFRRTLNSQLDELKQNVILRTQKWSGKHDHEYIRQSESVTRNSITDRLDGARGSIWLMIQVLLVLTDRWYRTLLWMSKAELGLHSNEIRLWVWPSTETFSLSSMITDFGRWLFQSPSLFAPFVSTMFVEETDGAV